MDARQLFEILMREHAGMLTAYLRAVVRDTALADDLFQETMLTAWKNLDRFDRSRPFGPWLRGIAGKLILAQRRKNAQHGFYLCDEQILEVLDDRLETVTQMQGDTLDEKLESIRDCVRQLPERYRQVVELKYHQELTPTALRTRLQVTAEALKKRLQRARARVQECFEKRLARILHEGRSESA